MRAGERAGSGAADAGPRHRLTPAAPPAPATELIGRERELAEVAAALAVSRLVTLTGTGGTGKTRLAVHTATELAGQYADGVAFADLAPLRDPALLAAAIATALGLTPPSIDDAELQVAEALHDRQLLLVADNVEHLADAAVLLSRLLAAAPALRILATSRVPLRLSGEHIVRVPPLRLPGDDPSARPEDSESVRLFLARAAAVRPEAGRRPGELAAIAAICAALDGLPLAVELAAARVRLHPPDALLPLLRSRLAVLTGGPVDMPDRQRTLHAALDWSYQLLPEPARQLFANLAVFAGSFDAAAATAVGGGDDDAADMLAALSELADHSLIEITPAATPHFRLLQTVAEYALARLAANGREEAARRGHLAYFLSLADDTTRRHSGACQGAALDALEDALPDIRSALDFAHDLARTDNRYLNDGLSLATRAGLVWHRRGRLAEGDREFRRFLALDDARQHAAAPSVRAAAVLEAGSLACYSGQYWRADELSGQALELCRSLGDYRGLAQAHRQIAESAMAIGNLAQALPHCEQQIEYARRSDDTRTEADAWNMLGQLYRLLGRTAEARQALRQSVRLFREDGDLDAAAGALHSLAEAERAAGHLSLAGRLYLIALRRHAEYGHQRAIAIDLEGLAALAARTADWHQALICLGAAEALREQTGAPLPPAEQAIRGEILHQARTALTAEQHHDALTRGRDQPLAVTVTEMLRAAIPHSHARAAGNPSATR